MTLADIVKTSWNKLKLRIKRSIYVYETKRIGGEIIYTLNNAVYNKNGEVIYGGQHNWIDDFVDVDGKTYLKAQHEENGLEGFYDKEGNILKDYGGQHHKIFDFFDFDGKKYLLARHEKNGPEGFYDKEGNILHDYGGQHYDIGDFVEVKGKKYLQAQHEKNGFDGFYDKEGKLVFGGQHYDIGNFVEIDGKKYLEAQHEKNGLWGFYDKEGIFYFDENEIYNKLISKYLDSEMMNKYDKTKQMVEANYCHEKNKEKAIKAFNDTILKIVKDNKPDMIENVNFILESVKYVITENRDVLECKI